jgi:hypothetical protein
MARVRAVKYTVATMMGKIPPFDPIFRGLSVRNSQLITGMPSNRT